MCMKKNSHGIILLYWSRLTQTKLGYEWTLSPKSGKSLPMPTVSGRVLGTWATQDMSKNAVASIWTSTEK